MTLLALSLSLILLAFSFFDENPKEKKEKDLDQFRTDEVYPNKKVFKIERMRTKKIRTSGNGNMNTGGFNCKTPSPSKSGQNPSEPSVSKEERSSQKTIFSGKGSLKKRDLKKEVKEQDSLGGDSKETPTDDVSESQDRKRKKHKTTEYYYLLERKALRMMRRYYKEAFESYASKYKYKQNLKRLEKSLADKYFYEYIEVEFARNQDTLATIGKDTMVLALETIILCDRYNKNEKVTEGLNFDQIRNLLNKYNSKNLKEFFRNIAHAFLFSHYFRLSSEVDVKAQKHVDQEKLGKQMESLFKKSLLALPDSISATVVKKNY